MFAVQRLPRSESGTLERINCFLVVWEATPARLERCFPPPPLFQMNPNKGKYIYWERPLILFSAFRFAPFPGAAQACNSSQGKLGAKMHPGSC